jgi:hypothetical protein
MTRRVAPPSHTDDMPQLDEEERSEDGDEDLAAAAQSHLKQQVQAANKTSPKLHAKALPKTTGDQAVVPQRKKGKGGQLTSPTRSSAAMAMLILHAKQQEDEDEDAIEVEEVEGQGDDNEEEDDEAGEEIGKAQETEEESGEEEDEDGRIKGSGSPGTEKSAVITTGSLESGNQYRMNNFQQWGPKPPAPSGRQAATQSPSTWKKGVTVVPGAPPPPGM